MMTSHLQTEVEQRLGKQIVSVAPLSAANKAQIYRLTLKGAGYCVAKVAESGMDVEAFMLNYLREKTKLPVPKVFYSNEHVIIMEFVESHHVVDEATQLHAAEILAGLHAITAEDYGFERDTLIGSLPQPNRPNRDWVYFFTEQRLLYTAGEALKENKIDKKMMKQVEKLAGKWAATLKIPIRRR